MANFKTMGKYLGASKITQVGQNNLLVRKFWLDTSDNPEYPNTPEFQLSSDKVTLVDNYKNGDLIEVSFSINGIKFTNKEGKTGVMTNLRAYKVSKLERESVAKIDPKNIVTAGEAIDDDLPF